MALSVILAFCCLFCSSCNDFIFKLFARKSRSRGLFVMIIGLTWGCMSLLLPDLCGSSLKTTVIWGTVSGLFSVIGNLMLIEAMGKQSAGLCSTIYRLNLALVVPGAAILFNESNTLLQYIGIAAAFAAVLLFLPDSMNNDGDRRNGAAGIILVILAAVLRAGMGLSYKYGFTLGASPNGVSTVNAACWLIAGPIYYFWRERTADSAKIIWSKLAYYSILSGILVFGICVLMAHSLQLGKASIVLPIMQMSFVITFILSMIFLKEKLTVYKFMALSCGAAALLLLSI